MCSLVLAQDSPAIGKWSGAFQNNAGNTTSITLDIKSVNDGAVTGVGTYATSARRGGTCRGDYPLEGTLKGAELDVRGKGGPAADCNFRVRGTIEGGALKGRFNNTEVTLSK
jgi:hypothetical protein